MALWTFRYYIRPNGGSDVREAYERGGKELQARFLSRMRILAQLPQREWHDTYYKTLSGPCDGLAEVRFKASGVQQRPLGFHSGDHQFTFLFWATERNRRFVPPSACATALARKAEVLRERDRTDALWLALE